jgi:PKD repeat protein
MKVWFTLGLLFWTLFSSAQTPIFTAIPATDKSSDSELATHFYEYDIFTFDATALHQAMKADDNDMRLQLLFGDELFEMYLYPSNLRSPDYILRQAGDDGITQLTPDLEIRAYRGELIGAPGGSVRLTMDEDYLYGTIQKGKTLYFIEPVNYFNKQAPANQFVLYKEADVIPYEGNFCGATELAKQQEKHKGFGHDRLHGQDHDHDHDHSANRATGLCYEVDLAIASDGLMFNSYGSIPAVENHNIAVMNNVAGNWDDEFADELVFVIVEQFVSTSPSNDPWTSSTNAGTLLNSFTSWGPSGFTATHDVGSLWTDRDFNGGTIGIAWLSAICTSIRYHCLQDFSSNAQLLRVLTSHELGHNFAANHDPSGTWIMSPSVNSSTQWSPATTNVINNYYPTRPCLSLCPPPAPPVALFSSNLNNLCEGSMVTFYDESQFSPNSWSWSFPGGTPSSSTEQNPTVMYDTPGAYNVTLTVSNNNGSNTLTLPAFIIVGPVGTDFFFRSDFQTGLQGWQVENPDGSTTWTNEQVGGTREGNRAMKMDNYNYNAIGNRDGLVSPVIDLSGRTNVSLEIEYAYVRYNSQYRDSLVVYVSGDNGVTYDRIFAATENGSGSLATAPATTSDWTPGSLDDWCYGGGFGNACLSFDISAYDDLPNVKVKIENVNGYGNNMYIDNVRLFSDCEISLPPVADFMGQPTNGCAPLTVSFTDQSLNNPISWFWSMPGAIPATSTSQDPVVIYTQPGTYDVTLTVTNLAGVNTITKTAYVTVDGAPSPDFTWVQDSLTYDFFDASTGSVQNYLWSFGDGSTSTDPNPTHTYAQDGTYLVALTVTGPCGADTYQQTLVVATPPAPAFSANVTEGCAPLAVQFIDQSTSNVTNWNWSFPGGNPSSSTDQNPFVVYDSPGTYDVTLTVSNGAGSNSTTQTSFITVEVGPTAGFTYILNGYQVDFANTSIEADSYEWDFGDGMGSSTLPDPSYTYGADGTYTVFLYATNGCGIDTFSMVIQISNAPVSGFTSDVTSGCAPLTVQFFEQASENVDGYEWQFPGGTPATSTAPNPVVTYNTAGVYDVTLTVFNAAGSDMTTSSAYITVDDVPDTGFTSSSNDLTVTLNNTTTNALSYFWDFGDGVGNSSMENPTYTYAQDGTYTITLTASNACGNVMITETITVSTLPLPAFTSDVTSGCAPLTVQFLDNSSENTTGWSWDFPGGDPATSNLQNPVVTYENPGVYDVTLTVSNPAGSNTVTLTDYITVLTEPTAAFTENVNGLMVDLTNNSTNATSYLWDFGDGVGNSTDVNPSYTYATDGTYTITLMATNPCGTVTTTEVVTIVTPPSAGFTFDPASGCAPVTVQFTDNSSANATGWNWTFSGGDPATSTDQNPVVVYDAPGTYSVTLEVTNAAGADQITQMDIIVVNDEPEAAFTESVNGLTVDLTNNSTNATSYMWDFGDGVGSSTDVNPSYTYATDGTYTITLMATNACGTVTTTEVVTIGIPPTAAFTFDPASGCAPVTVQFTDNSSANTTGWNWTFTGGDPATSTDQNPVVVYDAPGTYSVTLEVTNASGADQVTQMDIIVVNDEPEAAFTESVNGLTVDLTNNSTNATSYMWDFGDGVGSSTDVNPSYTYATDGTYTITLMATNACGTVTTTEVVTIVTPPTAAFTFDPASGCAPVTVQFTDNSSANATGWNWTFSGGDPATSTDQNPVVVYDAAGTYSVTLEVTNAAGADQVTQMDIIVVNDEPEVAFTESVNGLTVDLTNNSTNATSYMWDFGDGVGSSTDVNPSYTYATDGTYTITLMASNGCGTVTTTEVVTIATPPTAAFGSSVQSGCEPLTVQFFNQSSANAETFEWSFPGGDPSSSTDENPVVVYNTAGIYNVTLTVSNSAGESTSMQMDYIVVNALPTAGFSNSINGAMVDFTNNSTDGDTYSWDFGDGQGTSMDTDPSYTYAEDGIYTVTLTVTNDCGSVETETTIVIATTGPVALFTAGETEGCGPLTVQFENLSSENSDSFAWDFPGGNPATSTDEHPVVIYDTPGEYTVTLTAFNMSGSDQYVAVEYITVLPDPTANFSSMVMGPDVDFTNSSSNASSYLWFFGDGESSTDPNPEYTYDQTGEFQVMLIATNDCGSDTIVQPVLIEALIPQASFTADAESGCAPLTVQFFDASSGVPTAWDWNFEGGTPASSTEQNPVITFENPGQYDVSLMVSNSAGTNELVQNQFITVLGTPDAEFTYDIDGLEVVFTNTSSGGTSFSWDFGDNSTSNNPSPTHVYDGPGTYLVVLTVSNECGDTTFEQEVQIEPSSIADIESIDRFDLFPNPNDGRFQVILEGMPGVYGDVQLELFNVIGQRLYQAEQDFRMGTLQHSFELPDLAKGVYFFRIMLGDQSLVKEVIVQ